MGGWGGGRKLWGGEHEVFGRSSGKEVRRGEWVLRGKVGLESSTDTCVCGGTACTTKQQLVDGVARSSERELRWPARRSCPSVVVPTTRGRCSWAKCLCLCVLRCGSSSHEHTCRGARKHTPVDGGRGDEHRGELYRREHRHCVCISSQVFSARIKRGGERYGERHCSVCVWKRFPLCPTGVEILRSFSPSVWYFLLFRRWFDLLKGLFEGKEGGRRRC